MTKGESFPAQRHTLRNDLVEFRPFGGNQYIPYFYSPALNPDGSRLIFVGARDGEEQLYLLDLERDRVQQLTDAQGRDQNWSPYIREQVRGIRPQFICWAQPTFDAALFFENNTLKLVNIHSLEETDLYTMPEGIAPSVLHCSPNGWVCWGYLPVERQEVLRNGSSVFDIDADLEHGCGFFVYDLTTRTLLHQISTPFWPNHASASPDHEHVLLCHEGDWKKQRMYLWQVASQELSPLREQGDGARIGHEFWVDAQTVAYHGTLGEDGFFGLVNIATGERVERPSAEPSTIYGHYHLSPDRTQVVTDGEVSPDLLSIASLGSSELHYEPVAPHNWPRSQDQRVHPHPHWHANGMISFTGSDEHGTTHVRLLTAI